MKKGKVLFIDTAHDELRRRLVKQGFECEYFADFERIDYLKIVHNYIGIIVRSKVKLDSSFLEQCTNLKFIGRVGAGMENIDARFAESLGITCVNAPEGNRDAVGEQAVGMLLSLFNNLVRADNQVRDGVWIREGNRGYELGGKTIGIIGYGNTGMAFAKKLCGFDMEVLAYDKYKKDYSDEYATEVTMNDIFDRCDILSLHVPLTDETNYLVNSAYINSFRKNIYLVNTSRGKVLNTSDLVINLKSKKVLGACLDVLEFEGLSFENMILPEDIKGMLKMHNVVLSPHIAGWTNESNYKMAVTIAEKVAMLEL